MEQVFNAYEWGWTVPAELENSHFRTQEDFRRTVAELHAVDVQSGTFRYPINTKGSASLEAHFKFNVFEFCSVFDSLFPLLDSLVCAAQEEVSGTLEMMAETAEY